MVADGTIIPEDFHEFPNDSLKHSTLIWSVRPLSFRCLFLSKGISVGAFQTKNTNNVNKIQQIYALYKYLTVDRANIKCCIVFYSQRCLVSNPHCYLIFWWACCCLLSVAHLFKLETHLSLSSSASLVQVSHIMLTSLLHLFC